MRRFGLLWIAAAVFVLDQATKLWLRAFLELGGEREVLPFFTLVHWQNRGGLWGFLGGAPEKVTFAVFMVLPVLGVAFIVYLFLTAANVTDRALLSAMLGGALGNILDRVTQGAVTDFIYFHMPGNGPGWPAFNFADAFLSTSLTVFMLRVFLSKEGKDAS